MGMNKIIALVACSLMVSYSFAQKRPLDIKACSQWNRIDDAKLSPTGRYVAYKIVPIEQGFDEICNIPTILYDNKNKGKRIELGNVENIYYFNSDKQLYYTKTDSTGTTLTYVVDLPSGNKRLWKYPESLEPIKGVNLSASRLHIDEDKDKNIKSHNNLIIRNLDTNDSICIENILSYP